MTFENCKTLNDLKITVFIIEYNIGNTTCKTKMTIKNEAMKSIITKQMKAGAGERPKDDELMTQRRVLQRG